MYCNCYSIASLYNRMVNVSVIGVPILRSYLDIANILPMVFNPNIHDIINNNIL